MATVEKLGGNSVIVRAEDLSVGNEKCNSSAAEESANRLFWTGDRWGPQYGLAKQFLARQEAEAYLRQQRDEID